MGNRRVTTHGARLLSASKAEKASTDEHARGRVKRDTARSVVLLVLAGSVVWGVLFGVSNGARFLLVWSWGALTGAAYAAVMLSARQPPSKVRREVGKGDREERTKKRDDAVVGKTEHPRFSRVRWPGE